MRLAGSKAVRLLLFLAALAACSPLIAPYSLTAYQNATSLKARSLNMIDRSAEPYSESKEALDALLLDIDEAYEFAAGLNHNDISARQWALVRGPGGNYWGAFIPVWRAEGTTGQSFRAETKKEFAAAFDYIICLEANKRQSTECAPSDQEGGT
ncbi:MAG: hypothetical protein KDA73_08670 [Rhodobacteraceae bacterium]|nr:hypothetical protein [Paracoccaceae bacterium]